jgi:hypothetical protein
MKREPGPTDQYGKHTFEFPLALQGHNVAGFKQFDFIKLELKPDTLTNQPGGIHQHGSGASPQGFINQNLCCNDGLKQMTDRREGADEAHSVAGEPTGQKVW